MQPNSLQLNLYSYFRSSASYRVRLALEYKKVPYNLKTIHLLKDGGQQRSPDFVEKSRLAQVPCLEIMDQKGQKQYLSQSMAIVQFLEGQWPTPGLVFGSPYQVAQVVEFCEHINSGMQPLQNLSTMQFLEQNLKVDAPKREVWLHHWINKGLTALEKSVQKTSGLFCFGDSLTAADLFLLPQLFSSRRFVKDLSAYPKLLEIESRLLVMESLKPAFPENQPDFEPSA